MDRQPVDALVPVVVGRKDRAVGRRREREGLRARRAERDASSGQRAEGYCPERPNRLVSPSGSRPSRPT
jgi:hypothetical protein